jgi:hypothetical protein
VTDGNGSQLAKINLLLYKAPVDHLLARLSMAAVGASAGEYVANLNSLTQFRRPGCICQRSVKPPASPAQVRTLDLPPLEVQLKAQSGIR